jgi:hypothetical protein
LGEGTFVFPSQALLGEVVWARVLNHSFLRQARKAIHCPANAASSASPFDRRSSVTLQFRAFPIFPVVSLVLDPCVFRSILLISNTWRFFQIVFCYHFSIWFCCGHRIYPIWFDPLKITETVFSFCSAGIKPRALPQCSTTELHPQPFAFSGRVSLCSPGWPRTHDSPPPIKCWDYKCEPLYLVPIDTFSMAHTWWWIPRALEKYMHSSVAEYSALQMSTRERCPVTLFK